MKRCLVIKQGPFAYYDDLIAACEQNGMQTDWARCDTEQDMARLLAVFDHLRPDFILNHPLISPRVSYVGEKKGVPVVHWNVDPIINPAALAQKYAPTDHLLTTYIGDAANFRAIGVPALYFLNAWNLKVQDYAAAPLKYGVSFVGTVELGENNYFRLTMERFRRSIADGPAAHHQLYQEIERILDGLVAAQFEASKGLRYILPQLVAETWKTAGPLFEQVGWSPAQVVMILGKEVAHDLRIHLLDALPQVDAFGPEDWRHHPGKNVRYWGPVAQYAGSGHVFAQSRVNLSLPRIYAMDGFSDRIFNVLYAGGFLLTNRQETIQEVFEEDRDVAMFGDAEEMVDKIRFFERNEAARLAIARSGQKRASQEHSFAVRVGEIIRYLKGG